MTVLSVGEYRFGEIEFVPFAFLEEFYMKILKEKFTLHHPYHPLHSIISSYSIKMSVLADKVYHIWLKHKFSLRNQSIKYLANF